MLLGSILRRKENPRNHQNSSATKITRKIGPKATKTGGPLGAEIKPGGVVRAFVRSFVQQERGSEEDIPEPGRHVNGF